MEKNSGRIDLSGNQELRDYFSRKKSGDECSFTPTIEITDINPNEVQFKIKEIELPGDEETDDQTVKPTGDEPMSMMMEGGPEKAYAKEMPE